VSFANSPTFAPPAEFNEHSETEPEPSFEDGGDNGFNIEGSDDDTEMHDHQNAANNSDAATSDGDLKEGKQTATKQSARSKAKAKKTVRKRYRSVSCN
jgi:hypothetical protein